MENGLEAVLVNRQISDVIWELRKALTCLEYANTSVEALEKTQEYIADAIENTTHIRARLLKVTKEEQ